MSVELDAISESTQLFDDALDFGHSYDFFLYSSEVMKTQLWQNYLEIIVPPVLLAVKLFVWIMGTLGTGSNQINDFLAGGPDTQKLTQSCEHKICSPGPLIRFQPFLGERRDGKLSRERGGNEKLSSGSEGRHFSR